MGHPGLWWELGYPLGDLMLFLHHLSKTNVMERSIVTIPFESLDEIRKCYHSNLNMKLLQQCFHMVLFIQYVDLTFEAVDEILWCYHSNETSSAVLSHGTIYLVCSSNF